MGRLSDTHANNILDLAFSKATNGFPATLYVGLSSSTPTNTGTNVTEPSGSGYARVAVTNNATNWPAASARSKANGTAITFPAATGDWVAGSNLTHWVMYDAASAGTFVAWGAITTPTPVLTGTQPSFAVGAIVITAPGT
jgi:hypothetical protein